MGNIAVFLDRDGTVNEEVDFLSSPENLRLIPRAAEAIAGANRLGLRVFILTNQSGIARGLFTEEDLRKVNESLIEQLRSGGATIDRIYYCPHHPTVGNDAYRRECDCRKPGTGMMRKAIDEYGIDVSRSFVIGDRTVDVGMAKNAGAGAILVLTGYGKNELRLCERDGIELDYVAEDIFDAMQFVAARIAEENERTEKRAQ